MKKDIVFKFVPAVEAIVIFSYIFVLVIAVLGMIKDSYNEGYEKGQKDTIERIHMGWEMEESDLKITE